MLKGYLNPSPAVEGRVRVIKKMVNACLILLTPTPSTQLRTALSIRRGGMLSVICGFSYLLNSYTIFYSDQSCSVHRISLRGRVNQIYNFN